MFSCSYKKAALGDSKDEPGLVWLLFVGQGHSPPPPANRGALMHFTDFEDLREFVVSPSIATINELVNAMVAVSIGPG